jgi:hypothetical protein
LPLFLKLEISDPQTELVNRDLLNLSDGFAETVSQGDQVEKEVVVL